MRNIPIIFDCLWIDNYPNEIQLIKDAVYEEHETDQLGRLVSNVGGWQSKDTLHRNPKFEILKSIIEQQATQIHQELELRPEVKFTVVNMWANINWPGTSNSYHQHTNPPSMNRISSTPIISGSFYVSVPINSGRLGFHATRYNTAQIPFEPSIVRIPEIFFKNANNRHINPVDYHSPTEGDLIMFFADVMHGVEKNKSQEPRISVSFNLGLELNH